MQNILQAQQNDFIWLFGYQPSQPHPEWGLTKFDFNSFPVAVSKLQNTTISFDLTNTALSDGEGELLFYSNGIVVADASHQVMENGDSLNPGPIANVWYDEGNILQQGVLALPIPEQDRFYYLFHSQRESGDAQIPLPYTPFFYRTLVDMEGNGGLGTVVEKNVVVVADTLDVGKLTATKHANGRDWWILVPERDKYSYHRLLLTPDSIFNLGIQPVEPAEGYGAGSAGFVSFSPDGTKYARHDIRGFPAGHFVRLYDFDRCTGLLSNQIHLPLTDTAGVGGIAFSPNSKYMYVSSQELVYQYDVTAADVAATQLIVAETDGFTDTFDGQPWFPMTFSGAQLGPDGRIYIHSAGSSQHLHYIQYPNRPGMACEVRQHAIKLPTWTYRTIPNFPNYRLGPLDGSPCDTLGLDNHPLAGFTWEADTLDPLLVQFTDNSFYEPTGWLWDFGGTGSSTEVDPAHTFPADGTYTVCLTVSNPYDMDTFCREVTVSDLAADFSFEPEDLAVQFTDLSTSQPTDWRWDFGDGDTSVLQNPLHVYDGAGIYEVCLRASDAYGEDVVCREVDVTVSAAGEAGLGGISVYPNPAKGELRLTLPEGMAGGIFSLTDVTGRKVKSWKLVKGQQEASFSLEGVAAGVYFWEVRLENAFAASGKLVVSK